uniref:Proline-rich receptor-like protein kinase PERK10 n=1 Tax=Cicer arietinum TaxID=3827 RepID=A0A1S2Y5C2_CICAR|nr:proline-rich receptor-like protein kinase PERK10 [Cicer arietinum]
MARTKQSARKNASPCAPPSSSSSYQSIERSPSPPPRPTPPHTSSASPSSNTSQEVLNLIPLSTFLPPLYTRPTPNFAQVPPHLRTRITPPRHSMRVQSGIERALQMQLKRLHGKWIRPQAAVELAQPQPRPQPQPVTESATPDFKTSSSIFGISQFLNFPTTVGPSNPSVGPLPSVSSFFAYITSISTMLIPSNIVVATTSQPSAHLHSTPTLIAPSNSDIMAALQIIMARQVQHDQETALLRTWMVDHLASKLGIPPLPPHPIPPPSQVPHPGKSSSSEESSPSLAS